MNVLDLLLRADIPNPPEKEYRLKRLSEVCGAPVVFRLRALPYSRAAELAKSQLEDLSVHIVLAGVVEPDLKDRALLEKYGAATPAELVKKMLLPGEIEDLSRAVERLSCYRSTVIEEVKKTRGRRGGAADVLPLRRAPRASRRILQAASGRQGRHPDVLREAH